MTMKSMANSKQSLNHLKNILGIRRLQSLLKTLKINQDFYMTYKVHFKARDLTTFGIEGEKTHLREIAAEVAGSVYPKTPTKIQCDSWVEEAYAGKICDENKVEIESGFGETTLKFSPWPQPEGVANSSSKDAVTNKVSVLTLIG